MKNEYVSHKVPVCDFWIVILITLLCVFCKNWQRERRIKRDKKMSGKYVIPKKFFSCHPGFDPGSRFKFGFSRRIEAVSQDSGVKLAEEAKQRIVINYFSSPKYLPVNLPA